MARPYLYPHPEIPGRKVTRQRLYQLRRRDENRCPRCGGRKRPDRKTGKVKRGNCAGCQEKIRVRRAA